ncbi:LysR family transcriptional regulator [Desulfosporosinus sp. SB140]|uniref:LysR family transcriptional regulator n=1 Tax=Desulfosporosinus paludis TaxID=3115649 RepID=UPI0038900673
MELRQIEYFLEVARCLKFTQAANNLYVSQSTLSEQISKLEQELECQFFERKGKRIHLTDEGIFLRDRCEHIIKYLNDTIISLQSISEGLKYKINIGVLPTIALSWLPLFVAEFSGKLRGIQWSIKEEGSAKIEVSLKNYEIDLGITTLPSKDPSLSSTILYEEELVLIVPEQHRLMSLPNRCCDFVDFKDEPFIIYEKGFQLREIILNSFFKAGYKPNIIMEVERTESIKSLVESGCGVALVPKTCVNYPKPSHPHYVTLSSSPVRTVGILTRHKDFNFLAVDTITSHLLKFSYDIFTK